MEGATWEIRNNMFSTKKVGACGCRACLEHHQWLFGSFKIRLRNVSRYNFWVEWIIVSFLSPGPGIGVWYFILVKPIFFSHVYVLCGYVEDFSNRKVSPGSKDSILHFIIVFNVSWFVWKEHLVFVFQNTFVDSDYFYLFNQVI